MQKVQKTTNIAETNYQFPGNIKAQIYFINPLVATGIAVWHALRYKEYRRGEVGKTNITIGPNSKN